jgi:hypothetical protein
MAANVLNVLLAHQASAEIDRVAAYWKSRIGENNLLSRVPGKTE